MQLRSFLNGQVAVVYIDELPADQKYIFYEAKAWKRLLTGDHKISDSEVESQLEYCEEMSHARETHSTAEKYMVLSHGSRRVRGDRRVFGIDKNQFLCVLSVLCAKRIKV